MELDEFQGVQVAGDVALVVGLIDDDVVAAHRMEDALPGHRLLDAHEEGGHDEVAHVPVQKGAQGGVVSLGAVGGRVCRGQADRVFHPVALGGGAGDAAQALPAVHALDGDGGELPLSRCGGGGGAVSLSRRRGGAGVGDLAGAGGTAAAGAPGIAGDGLPVNPGAAHPAGGAGRRVATRLVGIRPHELAGVHGVVRQ